MEQMSQDGKNEGRKDAIAGEIKREIGTGNGMERLWRGERERERGAG